MYYQEVIKTMVIKSIKKEIIYRYGLSETIVSDNTPNLNKKLMKELCE